MVEGLDFERHGYRIERELGANRMGGRVTYLATCVNSGNQVVVKQFQFAKQSASWSEYDSVEREINVLRSLKHPGIPRYLNSFQTDGGFCIVQEYKVAEPLSKPRSFHPEDLKIVATKILRILVYLQNRIPPIIHRDLKPDNILVDEHLNVFLIDFGFARVGDGEVGVSSVVKGTLGFMPPEQLFNRQLTEASDLYGLGMTLICLLTQTKADDIGSLVDISYKVKFKHLVPKVNVHWVKWLEKLTEPRVKDRFTNAKVALKKLPEVPLYPPEVQLSHAEIQLQADTLGQILSCPITITNPLTDTLLTGAWQVQKHSSDPILPNQDHPWISITPSLFENNQVTCRVEVDTKKLMAGVIYNRVLTLHTNGTPQTYVVPIQIHTANLPVRSTNVSVVPLLLLFFFVIILARTLFWHTLSTTLTPESLKVVTLGLSIGIMVGLQGAAWTLKNAKTFVGSQLASWTALFFAIPTILSIWFFLEDLLGAWETILSGLISGTFAGWFLGIGMGLSLEKLLTRYTHRLGASVFVVSTSLLAVAIALGLVLGFRQPIVVLPVTLLSIILGSLLINAPLNYAKRVADYRKFEQNRVRP